MTSKNIALLNSFGLENIPDLEVAVLGALELFEHTPLPKIAWRKYKRPLVVGSGNAEATGRIIFKDLDAIFASESDYEEKLKKIKEIDGIFLISASGEKHAPIIAKTTKKYGKSITLITNTQNSSAGKILDPGEDGEFVFPKNREPYSYNTSTYLGMILSATQESPMEIYDFIEKNTALLDFSKLAEYDKFFLLLPTKFSGQKRMLELKFTELFGRQIAHSIETFEYAKHATTVVPAKELFISFGQKNETWGEPADRMFILLPENADQGAMMAIGYYLVSQIQKEHRPYFKENIASYTKKASEIFGQEIKPIVD
jgi:hypothetical protein